MDSVFTGEIGHAVVGLLPNVPSFDHMDQATSLPPESGSANSYDEAPYPSGAFFESHPDKLCAMGRLFGLNAPAPAQARVLELGCADGANLLPMAQHAPAGRFLGIDASARQIESGRAAVAAAGLTNVELRHQNILDFPAAEGKFDYIIVHGIYSWVPSEVRTRILGICREHLNENGVAYVSYNAFPGWGMRMALRDMLLFHTVGFADSANKVKQARALTAFLAEAMPKENNPFADLVRQELERMKTLPDNYLRHDILSETNQPFYFHEFANDAMRAGLAYLSETSLDQMLASNFSGKVAETLEKITSNIIAKEQYMDFVRNRSFRRTLLCHREAKINRNLTPQSIRSFYYTSLLAIPEPGTLDLKPGVQHTFKLRTSTAATVNSENSFVKAAFDVLSTCGLNRISFDELLAATRQKTADVSELAGNSERAKIEEVILEGNLLPLYTRGIIDIYADRPSFITSVPAKPAVTPLVRYQALHSRHLVNRAHQTVPFDVIGRHVAAECDGSKDLPALVDSVFAAAKQGKLSVAEDGKPVEDDARLRLILDDRVKRTVVQITAMGFLI